MNRHLFALRVIVKDGERAFLMRNGRFERVLEPGRHAMFDARHELGVELHNVVRAEFPADRYAVLKTARPDLAAELFEAVETRADEIAIVSLDGRPLHLMAPWQIRVFWKVATRVEVERIDVANDPKVQARHLAMIVRERNTLVVEHVVENHEAGLLYVEGRLVERLAPGRHAFWTAGRKIEVKRLDLRPQAVEITAQEMLTKDRIALRVTLTAFRRIVDPQRAVSEVPDVDAWLYRLIVRSAADIGRHRRRWRAEITVLPDEPAESDGASELADRDQIERGLRRLKEAHRTILALHFYVGLSPSETADALEIPVGTAKSRLHYAIEALRAAIAADERTPAGALQEGRMA